MSGPKVSVRKNSGPPTNIVGDPCQAQYGNITLTTQPWESVDEVQEIVEYVQWLYSKKHIYILLFPSASSLHAKLH